MFSVDLACSARTSSDFASLHLPRLAYSVYTTQLIGSWRPVSLTNHDATTRTHIYITIVSLPIPPCQPGVPGNGAGGADEDGRPHLHHP